MTKPMTEEQLLECELQKDSSEFTHKGRMMFLDLLAEVERLRAENTTFRMRVAQLAEASAYLRQQARGER